MEIFLNPSDIHVVKIQPEHLVPQQYHHNFEDLKWRSLIHVNTTNERVLNHSTSTVNPIQEVNPDEDPTAPIVPLFRETNEMFLQQINRRGNPNDLIIPHRIKPIDDSVHPLFQYNIYQRQEFENINTTNEAINIIL